MNTCFAHPHLLAGCIADVCPTHPLLHDFHLLLEHWQDAVLGQALVQLDHILAVFEDLCAELIKVQFHQCALGGWTCGGGGVGGDGVKLRREEQLFLVKALRAFLFFSPGNR